MSYKLNSMDFTCTYSNYKIKINFSLKYENRNIEILVFHIIKSISRVSDIIIL